MKTETIQALNAINLSFYASEAASEFSDSRQLPWSGWARVLAGLPQRPRGHAVLDVGCGNGRFAAYLTTQWVAGFRYTGVDFSDRLLTAARSRSYGLNEIDYHNINLLRLSEYGELFPGPYSLIVAFGVLHHVPSFEARRALVRALLDRLDPAGRLAITFWRFGLFERFSRRALSWTEYNQSASQPVDIDDLERGDTLLRWGNRDNACRYCHFADGQEIDTLVASLKMRVTDRYLSDGEDNQLNNYVLVSI
jgi:tRNA (uracil-5-)-methyltransferase TRM9